MILAKSIWQAEEVYHLANGVYTDKLNELDITPPNVSSASGVTLPSGKGECHINLKETTSELYCRDIPSNIFYFKFLGKQSHYCGASSAEATADQKAFAGKFCQSMGGTFQDGWWYKLP